MDYEIDNLTIILLITFASLLIYLRFFSLSSPLVHPLLLGKQSEVSSVRRNGESGIYRSFATGQGSPFTIRPANTFKTIKDVIQKPTGSAIDAVPRCILDVSLTDEALAEIVRLLPIGLTSLFPSINSPNSSSILALLPPSPITALPLLLLQLSARPSIPLVHLPSPSFLNAALTTTTSHLAPGLVVIHVDLVDDVVEQIWEEMHRQTGVLIVGDPEKSKSGLVKNASVRGMVVKWWEEIWEAADEASDSYASPPDPVYSDVHSYFYSQSSHTDTPIVVKVTQMNITAGVAGVLSSFPADKRPSATSRDIVASAARLDTPLGMTIALASIWNGAGLRFIGRPDATWPQDEESSSAAVQLRNLSEAKGQPTPTILFISSQHHLVLVESLHRKFRSRSFASFAARYKLVSLRAGQISRTGVWEGMVWKPIRNSVFGGVVGDKLRGVIVIGDAPTSAAVAMSNLLLSLPVSRLFPSPYSTGPIFVTHFYDLQSVGTLPASLRGTFSANDGAKCHVGAPGSNVEVVLKNPAIEDQVQIPGEKLSGRIWARGPAMLEICGQAMGDGWVDLEENASVQTNGTFIVG